MATKRNPFLSHLGLFTRHLLQWTMSCDDVRLISWSHKVTAAILIKLGQSSNISHSPFQAKIYKCSASLGVFCKILHRMRDPSWPTLAKVIYIYTYIYVSLLEKPWSVMLCFTRSADKATSYESSNVTHYASKHYKICLLHFLHKISLR